MNAVVTSYGFNRTIVGVKSVSFLDKFFFVYTNSNVYQFEACNCEISLYLPIYDGDELVEE